MRNKSDIDDQGSQEIAERAKKATKEAYESALSKGFDVTVESNGVIYTVRKSAEGKLVKTPGEKLPARTKASTWIKKASAQKIVSSQGRTVRLKLAK